MTHLSLILVIDDLKRDRDHLAEIINNAGHEVITAPDGFSGLILCSEKKPQIVFIDVIMPGLNGIEVLQKIKPECPGVKVILCTGAGDGGLVDLAMRLGADGYIVKPYDAERIFLCLHRTIGV